MALSFPSSDLLAAEKIMVALDGAGNEKIYESARRVNACLRATLEYIMADMVLLLKEFLQKNKESFLTVPSLKSCETSQ